MIRFEGYERRIAQIEACMKEYGIADLEDAKAICTSKGIDVDAIVRGIQNICFEDVYKRQFPKGRWLPGDAHGRGAGNQAEAGIRNFLS